MSLLAVAGANSASGGYDIDNSLKFEQDNSEQIHFTPSSAGNRRTWTFSCWLKRTELNLNHYIFNFGDEDYNQSGRTLMTFRTGVDQIWFGGGSAYQLKTSQVFRDVAAWYHIVLAVDTTQATDSNRLKLYVNGEQVTDFDATSYPTQNFEYAANRNHKHSIGYNHTDNCCGFSGYMSEVALIDGQQLTPSSFGETDDDSGIWKPKDLSTLTFGSNGFYLKFDDSSSLGADSSGNTNNFTLSNITAADQATDTPTNNFCTFNPLINTSNRPTINEGAMHVTGGGGTWNNAYGTMGVQNGKWYYEYKITDSDIGFFGASTFPDTADASNSSQFMYDQSFTIGYSAGHYYQRINGTQISNEGTGWGTAANGDIYGLFLNVDDQEFTVFRNGTQLSGTLSQPVSLNSAFSGHFVFPCNTQYENDGGEFNFGAYTLITNTRNYSDANGHGAFVYEPKIGSTNYYSLCSKNLAEFG